MNPLNLTDLMWHLELAMISLATVASLWAYLLIRSARRSLEAAPRRSDKIPYTPLTRENPKKSRELTRI